MSLASIRRTVDTLARSWDSEIAINEANKKKAAAASEALRCAREALTAAQTIATAIQHEAHEQIASIVERCLTAVFEDPYQFKINFERVGGRTEASLVFIRDGKEIDPLTASGGGVVDIAAFALRLGALVLSKPQMRRLLILDEPFRFVSSKYRPAVASLLEELTTDLGVQIIQVTHIQELVIGKVHEIG